MFTSNVRELFLHPAQDIVVILFVRWKQGPRLCLQRVTNKLRPALDTNHDEEANFELVGTDAEGNVKKVMGIRAGCAKTDEVTDVLMTYAKQRIQVWCPDAHNAQEGNPHLCNVANAQVHSGL